MSTTTYKRRRKLIKPRLQLRLSAIFASLCALSCLLMGLLFSALLSEAASTMPQGGEYLVDLMPSILGQALLATVAFVLPLTIAVGVLTTFPIAGPVYRFEQYLQALARGEVNGPCRIRTGDQLQELCEIINEATAPLWTSGANEEAGEDQERSAA